MSGTEQRVAAASIHHIRIETGNRSTLVRWDESDEIVVRGGDLELRDQGDEIVIRARRRRGREHGHGHGHGRKGDSRLFELGDQTIRLRWGKTGEISLGPDGLKVEGERGNASFSYPGNGHTGDPATDLDMIEISVPATLNRFSAESDQGLLQLQRPRGELAIQIKRGDLIVHDAVATLAVSIGSGSVAIDKHRGALAIETGSGDIQLNELVGECAVKTGHGSVRLSGGSSQTAITSGTGDILIQDHHCEHVAIQTGHGDVSILGGTATDVAVQTGSGDISCTYRMGLGRHALTSGSGDIAMNIMHGLPARFEVVATRGRIDSEVPLVAVGQRGPRSASSQRLVGSIGEAAERAQISLRSGQGNIRLRWDTPVGSSSLPASASGTGAQPGTSRMKSLSTIDPEQQRAEREILEALASGKLTVAEAGHLLDNLKNS